MKKPDDISTKWRYLKVYQQEMLRWILMTTHLSISGLQKITHCVSMLMTYVSQMKPHFPHDPAVGDARCAQLGDNRGPLGGGGFHHGSGSAVEGPEGFPQGELIHPRRVIKMEACFDKGTLGHFFPT